ncbi:tRNA pseudouridine(38-40) synthase TruA [Rhodobacteraceae bacterium NNCM2]|nr:tRNA pseudouridine(38-40) synthase TruA [Coraliihabitans acroporae]
MPRYKLTIEYHGGPFVGWQRQDNGVSVQGQIEAALRKLEPEAGAVQGAGRTDAGVHATGQVGHCDMAQEWDPFRLTGALNYHLKPHPISIIGIERVADDFHARFDAVRRDYRYRLICRKSPLAIERGLAWRVNDLLDGPAMHRAAQALIGKHDFTTFRSAKCQSASPVKTLDQFDVVQEGDAIDCFLSARSFLHNQVRSFVGTLVQVGLGRWPVGRVREALEAADRSACGPVAPPEGLYLTGVHYSEGFDP